MGNLEIWDAVKTPPKNTLKPIQAGRLKGKTDINPQWRYQVMTEQFGICGVGWKYTIDSTWTELAPDNQVFVFASVSLYIRQGGGWSEPIPGIGGSYLVTKESAGLHASDEGYKMAVTDALSVAMKMLGVGADIYLGLHDSKYDSREKPEDKPQRVESITEPQRKKIMASAKEKGYLVENEWTQEFKAHVANYGVAHLKELTKAQASQLIEDIEASKIGKKSLVETAIGLGAEVIETKMNLQESQLDNGATVERKE